MSDELLHATCQMFATEKAYNWKLNVLMDALQLLLSPKHPSIVDIQLEDFVEQTSSICICSIAVICRLEKIISTWQKENASASRLGSILDDSIWERYEAYHQALGSIRSVIRFKRRHIRSLANLCEAFERSRLNGSRLERLLLLPEERIIAYNEHLDSLVRCTSDDHPDYTTLKGHKDRIEQWGDQRRDAIRCAENEQKLYEIEAQFAFDHLNLFQDNWLSTSIRRAFGSTSGSAMNNVKHFVGRRKSIGASVSAPTWFRNSTDNSDNSLAKSAKANNHNDRGRYQGAVDCSSPMHSIGGPSSSTGYVQRQSSHQPHLRDQETAHALKQQQQYSGKMETFVRVYIKEGRVVLYTGVQAQERYLFLFSDLLLVAKENYRGINSYRLKEKIRLCEVWLSEKGLDDVAETVRSPQYSFVIGWPTKSYVAEFKSAEERDSWYEILVSIVTSVKRKERPNTTIVNVRFKDGKAVKNCDVSINNFQTAKEMRDIALVNFNVALSSADEYQLWVQSGRETGAYPLHGHECPFAILLSHIRDLLPDSDGDVDVSLLNDLTVGGHGIKWLKKNKASKHAAGQLVSHLKRKMKKQDSTDSACPPSPTGKLFGVPLDVLTETQPVPKPILALMEHLATEGVYMEGIFRKPPKNSTLRELKEKLDAGCDVALDGVSPSVSASLLKEFFRQLPDALLGNEKINAWVSLCDETNPNEKLHKARSLVLQLPPSNSRLLRYFICLLHIIAKRSAYNQMNSFNLGVCVAPSLTGSSRQGNLSGMVAKKMSELAQYLIDNAVPLFGEETLTLLKAPDDQPELQSGAFGSPMPVHGCNSGDDYDALVQMKQETSSLDSLTATGSSPSSSRPHSSLHQAVNISRDSGLCEAHVHSKDNHSVERCLSQSEDTEDDACPMASSLTAQSVDDLVFMKDQKRRSRVISEADANGSRSDDTRHGRNKTAMPSRQSGLHRQQVNIDSVDSIYEPAANSSLRSSRRVSSASLIRSASGDHLYLTERLQVDNEPSLLAPGRDQQQRHSGRCRSPRPGADHSPLTVSLTAGDSSYGSSPVSPESNDCHSGTADSSRSFDAPSPVPAPFMSRNSAYRKPARRKLPAPQAPSPNTVCVDDEETECVELEARQDSPRRLDRAVNSTDTSNDDEADSGVHVMEVHSARPVIVSCNCESSSSISSDDEKLIRSDRKDASDQRRSVEEPAQPVAITLSPTSPSSTVISEIYPLKSPSQRVWPGGATRFIVDSSPAASKVDSPVVRRHSARTYSTPALGSNDDAALRRSYDDASTLTERVFRGLELMMEKVENAHISQEKLFRSHAPDLVNDSSTVTEASSEESTPHVSRESSSAQEYKQVARGMFDQPNSPNDYFQPRSYKTLPIIRSNANSAGSTHSMLPNATVPVPPPAASVMVNSRNEPTSNRILASRENFKSYSHFTSDPSFSGGTSLEPMPWYRAEVVRPSERPSTAANGDGLPIGSVTHSITKPAAPTSQLEPSVERIVPVIPGQVRDRVQRYDRERLRRKTLGGLEFNALAQMAHEQQAEPIASPDLAPVQSNGKPQLRERVSRYEQHRSSAVVSTAVRNHLGRSNNPQSARSKSLDRKIANFSEENEKSLLITEEDRRCEDISWSVRRYVEMFDNAGKRVASSSSLANLRRPSDEKNYGVQKIVRRENSVVYQRQTSTDYFEENRRPIFVSGIIAQVGTPSSKAYNGPSGPRYLSSGQNGTSSTSDRQIGDNWHQSRKPDVIQRRERRRNGNNGNSESYV